MILTIIYKFIFKFYKNILKILYVRKKIKAIKTLNLRTIIAGAYFTFYEIFPLPKDRLVFHLRRKRNKKMDKVKYFLNVFYSMQKKKKIQKIF